MNSAPPPGFRQPRYIEYNHAIPSIHASMKPLSSVYVDASKCLDLFIKTIRTMMQRRTAGHDASEEALIARLVFEQWETCAKYLCPGEYVRLIHYTYSFFDGSINEDNLDILTEGAAHFRLLGHVMKRVQKYAANHNIDSNMAIREDWRLRSICRLLTAWFDKVAIDNLATAATPTRR